MNRSLFCTALLLMVLSKSPNIQTLLSFGLNVEQNNLAPSFSIASQLRAELDAWQQKTRAPVPTIPNPECVLAGSVVDENEQVFHTDWGDLNVIFSDDLGRHLYRNRTTIEHQKKAE